MIWARPVIRPIYPVRSQDWKKCFKVFQAVVVAVVVVVVLHDTENLP